jgi:hypothetical protein
MNPLRNPQHPCAPADESEHGGGAGTMAEARHTVAEKARETATHVKSAASDATARAKDKLQQIAAERKEQTARRLGNYGSAIHESARSLEDQDPNIAWFTHRCADQIDQVAHYVRTHDFDALRRDAEDVARRHPAAFFGGMFLAGLVLGNLAKASRREPGDDQSEFTRQTRDEWPRNEPDAGFNETPTAAPTPGF